MNQYLLLSSENVLTQIIPEEDPVFPGVSIEERYTAELLAQCVVRSDEQIAEQRIHTGMTYDPETETFNDPPEPEPVPVPEPIPEPGEPTWTERIETLESENRELQAKLDAAVRSNRMLEDCLVEMAEIVYA